MLKKIFKRIFSRGSSAPSHSGDVIAPSKHRLDVNLVSSSAMTTVTQLQQAGYCAYIVGGAVRDLLIGITPKDFDIATDATPPQVKKLFRRAMIIGRRFQIVHVLYGREIIEVTTFRGGSVGQSVDEHGRVLRDNDFGSLQDDALRRDFTINSMYYDPVSQVIIDFHQGYRDIQNKQIKIIGAPEQRYREDPVRMLRAIRLSAKLQFTIAADSYQPLLSLAPLLDNVPKARLFDEVVKMLTCGRSLACLQQLRDAGLQAQLFPILSDIERLSDGEQFIKQGLAQTDYRVEQQLPVSSAFLFAVILWPLVKDHWQQNLSAGLYPIPAMLAASDTVLDRQANHLPIPRRVAVDSREIWLLQPRFKQMSGKKPFSLMQHSSFRAAYDFMMLRDKNGEYSDTPGITDWWTDFQHAKTPEEQQAMLQKEPNRTRSRSRSKKRSATS